MARWTLRDVAEGDQTRFEERQDAGLVVSPGGVGCPGGRRLVVGGAVAERQQPLAPVFLDLRAMLARQAFELHDIEPAARDDDAVRVRMPPPGAP